MQVMIDICMNAIGDEPTGRRAASNMCTGSLYPELDAGAAKGVPYDDKRFKGWFRIVAAECSLPTDVLNG